MGGEEVLFRFIPLLCSPLNLLAEIKSRLGVGSYIVNVLSGVFFKVLAEMLQLNQTLNTGNSDLFVCLFLKSVGVFPCVLTIWLWVRLFGICLAC